MQGTTNTARWLPLCSLCLALVATACGSGEASASPEQRTPAQLYESQGCATCHKVDGRGNAFGPSLAKVSEYWTRESLAEYLGNPQATVAKDPRLMAIGRNYSMQMPPVRLPLELRLLLAEHALSLGSSR